MYMDDNTHYKQTHKTSVNTANFLLYFYIFSSIVLVISYDISDFSLTLSKDVLPYLSIIVANVFTAFLCTILIGALIRKNQQAKSELKEILIFFFIFSALPAYIFGFHYFSPANNPTLVEYNLISPQFLIPGATFFLAFFVMEVFDKGLDTAQNQVKLRIIALICLIACILNFIYMLIGIGDEKNATSATLINTFYFLIILPLYAYFYIMLMIKSFLLKKRITEDLYRKGIMSLGLAGTLLGVIYILRIILFFASPPSILVWNVVYGLMDYGSLAGYILLYIGITLPSKNKETKSENKQLSKMMVKIIEMQQKEKIKKQKTSGSQDISQTRLEFEKTGKMMKVAKNIQIEKTMINDIEAEFITPKQGQSKDVILYLHGGGYLYCSINTHRGLASLIVEHTQMPVLIINYRRAPENKYPAALEDALSSYEWLLTTKSYPPNNIIIGGDSAGGGLAMAALLKLKDLKKPLPKAAFLISPWLDLTFSGESFETKQDVDVVLDRETIKMWAKVYLGEADASSPYASPLFGDLSDLPPIFIQVGTSELLFSDSTRLFDRLNDEKNKGDLLVWDQLIHAFPLFAAIKFIGKFIPESNEAVVKIKQFLERIK
jgi:acetyl esterase/lipase